MTQTVYSLHRASTDECLGHRSNPSALVNLAEIAGRGTYYVHNGVGVVAACKVPAAGRTVEVDRHPYIDRKIAGADARSAYGIED